MGHDPHPQPHITAPSFLLGTTGMATTYPPQANGRMTNITTKTNRPRARGDSGHFRYKHMQNSSGLNFSTRYTTIAQQPVYEHALQQENKGWAKDADIDASLAGRRRVKSRPFLEPSRATLPSQEEAPRKLIPPDRLPTPKGTE